MPQCSRAASWKKNALAHYSLYNGVGNGLSCESRNRYSLHAILDRCRSIIGDQSRSYGLHSTISYSLESDTFTNCPKHTYEPKYLQMLYYHVLVTISISHTIEEPERCVYC